MNEECDERSVRAWHEAGHAAISVACGFRPVQCDILRGPGRLGHFEHEERTEEQQAAYAANDPELLTWLTFILMGGAAGERQLARVTGVGWPMTGWLGDQRKVSDLFLRLGLKDRAAAEDRYLGVCDIILSAPDRTAALEATAAELLGQRAMSTAMLDRLWKSVRPLETGFFHRSPPEASSP